jgi:hypothetical protein
MQAAVAHGRPVADGGHVQLCCRRISNDELLGSLQCIEDACRAVGGESDAVLVGEDGVALGEHLVGHGDRFGGAGGQRLLVGLAAERRAEAGDENVRRGGRVCDGDAALGHGGLEVGDGEGIFGVAGLLAVDTDAGRKGQAGSCLDLARHRNQVQGGLRGCGKGQQSYCENAKSHTVTVQH